MKDHFTRRGFMWGLGSLLTLPLFSGDGRATGLLSAAKRDDGGDGGGGTPPPISGYTPVVAPGVPNLKSTLKGNVREFHLSAEPVTLMWPDMTDGMGMTDRPIYAWGYNGSSPGPTMEAVEGEIFRCVFTNNLSEPTTVHFHGLYLPINMDGVPDFSQDPVPPGGTFVYEFPLIQSGTYLYHSHFMSAKQVGMGLMGFFIIHPKNPPPFYKVDHDYAFFLHTWKIEPGSPIPNTLEMTEFNYFTMNGRPGPKIPAMRAKVGEKVRIRVTNLSMLTHPVHLHGHGFKITDWGDGFLPESQHIRANTINVSSAEVRTLEFTTRAPGKWMFHCHFTHHTMNDMHRPPQPSDPPMMPSMMAMMDMGGMMTWIDVKA
jgi:FtsP/CotA-like multicopper oxidase with cupredoxin domain